MTSTLTHVEYSELEMPTPQWPDSGDATATHTYPSYASREGLSEKPSPTRFTKFYSALADTSASLGIEPSLLVNLQTRTKPEEVLPHLSSSPIGLFSRGTYGRKAPTPQWKQLTSPLSDIIRRQLSYISGETEELPWFAEPLQGLGIEVVIASDFLSNQTAREFAPIIREVVRAVATEYEEHKVNLVMIGFENDRYEEDDEPEINVDVLHLYLKEPPRVAVDLVRRLSQTEALATEAHPPDIRAEFSRRFRIRATRIRSN